MRFLLMAVVVATMFAVGARHASAQQLDGFATFGLSSDLNDQRFAGVGGGVVVDLPRAWVSVGGQADVFFSNGYAAGRIGPLVQANVLRGRAFRVFALGGYGFGELGGPTFGGGVEVSLRGRMGFRATVQDSLVRVAGFDCGMMGHPQAYCDQTLHGGRPFTGHQPSVQFGIVLR